MLGVAGSAGSRSVNVEPAPSTLQTLTSPPCTAAMCLTMARPSPVPPVALARAGIHAVEALEDPELLGLGDADALVHDGELDRRTVHAVDTDHDARPVLAVRHGVVHEIAQRHHELALAAEHGNIAGAGLLECDVPAGGDRTCSIERCAHHVVERDRLGRGQRVIGLQPRQLEQLTDELGQAGGLDLHAPGEALHRHRVLARILDRLGEQRECTDRSLELVAHVRDEVAAYGLEPVDLSAVLDEEQHLLRTQRGDPRLDVHRCLAVPVPGELQVLLPDHAVATGRLDHLHQVRRHEAVVAEEPVRVRRRAGLQHHAVRVQDDRLRLQHREDRRDPGRHGRCHFRLRPRTLRGAKREAGGEPDREAAERNEREQGEIHVMMLGRTSPVRSPRRPSDLACSGTVHRAVQGRSPSCRAPGPDAI